MRNGLAQFRRPTAREDRGIRPDHRAIASQMRASGSGLVGDGFTLLEVIVVVVILGILASVMVPRFLNVGQRQAEAEAQAVQRVLSIAAEKSDVWSQPVAIDFSEEKGFLVLTRRPDSNVQDGTASTVQVKWRTDGLVEPVSLDRLRVSLASQDGVALPSTKWRVTFIPGQPRPVVSIQLDPKSERDGPRWTISLAGDDPVARRAKAADASANGSTFTSQSRTIDLDDSGKGQTPW